MLTAFIVNICVLGRRGVLPGLIAKQIPYFHDLGGSIFPIDIVKLSKY
jgi:hypothetical protein